MNMSKSKWRFRQDDLDTILTVINQGLMKKPYHVEYHDTYEDGTPVWNGEKSVLWNLMEQAYPEERAAMMRRMLAKMEELGGLQKGTHQQKLFAFFEKYYFSVINNFSSMLYNEDGKMYEKMKLAMLQGTYTNDTDPLGQSLGDGKSPEVAWVKKRNGTSDQQLSVKSADYLLDIGDWSSYVINGALSIIGKRLKRLKLGDENEQKVKILIASLTLGNTTSLEEIDVQNISTLGGSLDMRSNFRLRKFLAGGSSLTEAHFADGGALEDVDYPASTSYVELKNLDKLTNEKCNTEACAPNVMSYFVSGCDNLQPIKMLIGIMDAQVGQVPHSLRYVRCVGFNETFTDGRAFDKLSQLVDGTYQGIDAEGQYGNDPYPVLDGTINLTTGAYRDTYDALMTHYPKLKLNIAKWWIRFEDPEVKRICVENWDKDGDGELSMEEAAAVSSIGTMFRGGSFKSLKELGMFGTVKLSDGAFQKTTVKESIVIPEGCTSVATGAFQNATVSTIELPSTISFLWGTCFYEAHIDNLIFHGTQPPKKYGYWEFLGAKIKHIYVPDESIESYRSANLAPWLEYEPLSKYHS